MTIPVHEFCRVGIVHYMAYPECMGGDGPVVETVTELAEDPYFTAIEVTHISSDSTRAAVKSIVLQAGMKCAYGAQPVLLSRGLSLSNSSEPERKKAIQAVIECVDEAVEVGARGVAVISGKYPEDGTEEKAKALLVESLHEICAHCVKFQMPLNLETYDRLPIGKNALIGPTKDAVEIAEIVKATYPHFGLLLDLAHMPLLGERPLPALRMAQRYVAQAHMGNCVMSDPAHPAYGDEYPYFGIEGGCNDVTELSEYLDGLRAVGYLKPGGDRILSFEVKPIMAWGHTSRLVVANCKRVLTAAWARISATEIGME